MRIRRPAQSGVADFYDAGQGAPWWRFSSGHPGSRAARRIRDRLSGAGLGGLQRRRRRFPRHRGTRGRTHDHLTDRAWGEKVRTDRKGSACRRADRTQSQRSWSSNERARDGRGHLAQRQSRALDPRSATAVQDSNFSGRGPRRPFEHGQGNPLSASPVLRASCCSTSSGGRGVAQVEVDGPAAAVEAVRRVRFGM